MQLVPRFELEEQVIEMANVTNTLQIEGEGFAEPVEKKFKPVIFFAISGAIFLALEIYVMIDWIFFSGKVQRTPTGPDPVPEWMQWSILLITIVTLTAFVLAIYFFLIKPWRRDGHISTDGLFVFCFILIYWQDPFLNYTVTISTYNAQFFNLGAWTESVPGWMSPRGSLMAEALIWSGPCYLAFTFTICVGACWLMRKFKAWRPQTGNFGMFMFCFAAFMVIDFIAETIYMRSATYTYAGVIPELTMFYGHYYQFPIYEVVIGGFTWAVWASLRYFKNDKGHTIAERGVDELRISQKRKTFVRFLALSGALNLAFLFLYNVPHNLIAPHTGPWPQDIQERSYLTNGFCGPDTTWACNAPNVPIPRKDAPHLSPQGTLVPPDTKDTPIFISDPTTTVGGR